MAGVVSQIEAEERAQRDRLFATTEELEMARSMIRCMEEEVEKAKADMARQVSPGPIGPEPVASVTKHIYNMPVAPTAPDTSITREQELSTLREELEAQEALRAREREQKKASEDEKRRLKENLRKSCQLNDRLKEEKEKLLQQKDKLRQSAETEIEWLKEEPQQ